MITNQPFGKLHIHKSKIVNNSKKILPTFVLLLGATSLSGLPNVAKADEEMIIIADKDGDGVIDGSASEWATDGGRASAISSDGSVIAGYADDGTTKRTYRWDATNGMVSIRADWVTGSGGVSAMSSDGSVIAGHLMDANNNNTMSGYRWDATTGMVNIADTDGDGTVDGSASEWANDYTNVSAMNSDGSVIAGNARDDDNYISRAFRWDATTGIVNLADTDGDGTVDGSASEWATGNSYASAISSDGSVIAGTAIDVRDTRRAFRWDATTGMVNLADTDGDGVVDRALGEWATGHTNARAISSDGSVIAGNANDGTENRVFRWDATNGMVNITGDWATGNSYTAAISSDGSVIAGYANDGDKNRAFRWDAANGMVNIADTDGDGTVDGSASEWATGSSSAAAMSSDGSVLAGYANDGSTTYAFRWDATTGMVNLADTDGNGTVDGSASEWATGLGIVSAMSSDGSVIVGYANDGNDYRSFVYRGGGGGAMLDATNTQTSIVQNASAQGAAVASVNSSISAIVQTEIEVAPPVRLNFFADPQSANKLPTAINIMASRSSNKNASNVSIGGITAAVVLPNELTVGGFAALGTDGTSLSGFGFDGTLKAFGGFVRGASLGNTNLSWKASIATSGGDVKIARDSSLTGTEAASGNSKLTSKSASFEVGYKTLLSGQAVSPYLRLTRAITTRDAYTEQADNFPIAYSENKQTATTATVGIKMQTELPSKIALRYGLGVDFDLARSDAAIEGTSQIPGMTSISVAAPAVQNKARLLIKSGLTKFYYDGSSMSFDLGIQQNTYSSGTTVIGSVGYTVQF